MNLITAVLRAIRWIPHSTPDPDDQLYSEAVMENAVRESDKKTEAIAAVAQKGAASNARLSQSIERLEIASTDKHDVMADLVRGMKSRKVS